jgi:hypothetical protein
MKGRLYVLSCSLIAAVACAQAMEPGETTTGNTSGIRHVTLYRDRAMVTREITVPPGESLRTIVVRDLPQCVISDSVYAEGLDGAVVRSVHLSPRTDRSAAGEELSRFDEELTILNRKLEATKHELEVASQNLAMLDQMVDFTAAAVKSDLDRGVLDAQSLTRLATFSMRRRNELANERYRYETRARELAAEIEGVQSKRSVLASPQGDRRYDARIALEAEENVAGMVRLSYQVDGAGRLSTQSTATRSKAMSRFATAHWPTNRQPKTGPASDSSSRRHLHQSTRYAPC